MIKGIDLSQHNGNVDFTKVKNSGIEFVILRIGWIGNKENHTLDTKFEEFYKKAKEVGLKVGAYVYSYVENETAMQLAINWVNEKISGKTFEYPIFLDLEDSQISNLSKDTLTKLARQFCWYIENSGVYANKNWFTTKINVSELTNYKIWVAEWNGKDMHTADFKVDLWQYTSKGKVDGISGNVDMNYCLNCEGNTGQITGQKSLEEIANAVIRGDYGNGEERKQKLTAEGYNYEEVKAKVNEILGVNNNNNYVTYTVKSGDTLSEIAQKYGTTYQEIAALNGLADPNKIYPGQVLKIKISGTSTTTYTVKSGDTLSVIASKYGTTYQKLATLNGLADPNKIYVGQVLKIQ